MSFPMFRFKDLVKETWEDSTFKTYLDETKFLFVVYKYDEWERLRLVGCQFWNIPYSDLEDHVQVVWNRTKHVLKEGLQIKVVNGRNTSNLPKSTEDPVCHVRPHARDANDVDELPDGRVFPKQCFWLHRDYILSQLKDELKR